MSAGQLNALNKLIEAALEYRDTLAAGTTVTATTPAPGISTGQWRTRSNHIAWVVYNDNNDDDDENDFPWIGLADGAAEAWDQQGFYWGPANPHGLDLIEYLGPIE